ncbi:hypothetical protein [Mucilaginibacter dorajii]|uniref:Cadherin domain-containing protein n=1 Tax=Mucilaginibacter dorajii TaxID=692994 RepID=A0ABP7QBQ3_9SPHI|nr:hypothetical protein [Mucilaginibacter dorajii]MCS3733105.1 hypothetical protein [Mucilaginibacter dorajii]
MKTFILFVLFIGLSLLSQAQVFKFNTPSPLNVQKASADKNISIGVSLAKATKDCTVSFKVDTTSSALSGEDYVISIKSPIILTAANKYKGIIQLAIKAEKITNLPRKILKINVDYKDEKGAAKDTEFVINVFAKNDGSADALQYTVQEEQINRHLSFEVFTGGTFDFTNNLKFPQTLGGELVINATDIFGKDKRFGFFLGVSNFQNFTVDSSNANLRVQRIRLDTGVYLNGKTQYKENTFIDHKKLSSNQWSYYINPTFRINKTRSDFVNLYLSFRAEIITTSTQTQFLTDTVSSETTNRPLGNSPIFQSGKGFLLQKATDVETNGFYSLGLPVFLTSQDKFNLYIDPNLGITSYTYGSYIPNATNTSLQKFTTLKVHPFGLFKFRVTEQYSGLNITIGGEIRDVFGTYHPSINAYLGIKANIGKWFSK